LVQSTLITAQLIQPLSSSLPFLFAVNLHSAKVHKRILVANLYALSAAQF